MGCLNCGHPTPEGKPLCVLCEIKTNPELTKAYAAGQEMANRMMIDAIRGDFDAEPEMEMEDYDAV